MSEPNTSGSVNEFRRSWKQSEETGRYHFRRGQPRHQVQFAFQNHWRVFARLLEGRPVRRVLEVGSGRGSMGAYFADAGLQTHLLDTSLDVLFSASRLYAADGLTGMCVNGDALGMPYAAGVFDVSLSIGLLEHFEDIRPPLLEQLRILRPGGMLLCYVVPENPWSVQSLAAPLNAVLKFGHALLRGARGEGRRAAPAKSRLYRNSYRSADYLKILAEAGATETGAFGMFPLPLVSHSPSFPFSPMSPVLEAALMALWRFILALRKLVSGRDPWICSERWGLAFLVWARKPGGAE